MTRRSDDRQSVGCTRRGFLVGGAAAGAIAAGGLGAFYYGYETALGKPVRVGVIGTGDEGNVLLGAMNPKFLEVRAIADARPYGVYRAFHGEIGVPSRPGLLSVYGWKSESEARKHVKVYSHYEELLENAQQDGLDGVVIALPLFLHAPVAIAAMRRGLHVLTEKLMGHSVHECKEMARTAAAAHGCEDGYPFGDRAPAALQHPLCPGRGEDPAWATGRLALHPRPVAPQQSARKG